MNASKTQLNIGELNDDDVISSVSLVQSNLSGVEAEDVSLDDVDLTGVNFSSSVLRNISLKGCNLTGCNLSNACVEDGYMENVKCSTSKLTGIDAQELRLKNSLFEECAAHYSNFRRCVLRDVSFFGCNFLESDFQGAEFHNVIFRNCDLRKMQMSQSNFINVDIRGSRIDGISLEKEKFDGLKVDTGQAIYLASLMGLKIKD